MDGGAMKWQEEGKRLKLENKRKMRKQREDEKKIKPNPENNGFTCPICDKTFTTAPGLKRHTTSIHNRINRPQINITCPKCSKVCRSQSGFTRHKCIVTNSLPQVK